MGIKGGVIGAVVVGAAAYFLLGGNMTLTATGAGAGFLLGYFLDG